MANSKVTLITLSCPALGERQFEVSHAERLLAMPNNGGWQLPDGSEYEFANGTISRKVTKGNNAKK